ncbi:hypothetical protein L1887_33255 [Cichorium endivia]|nr:hypothetical protein L1887_33255 [Cichorium endivia]
MQSQEDLRARNANSDQENLKKLVAERDQSSNKTNKDAAEAELLDKMKRVERVRQYIQNGRCSVSFTNEANIERWKNKRQSSM